MKRVAGLDIFRICCCVGVIIYHVVDDIFLYQGTDWGLASVFYFGAAYCIPGFFLLSGYLIGKKKKPSMEYVEHKLAENFKKYMGWVLFWCVMMYVLKGQLLNPIDEALMGLLGVGGGITGSLVFIYVVFTVAFFMCIMPFETSEKDFILSFYCDMVNSFGNSQFTTV